MPLFLNAFSVPNAIENLLSTITLALGAEATSDFKKVSHSIKPFGLGT